jgi:carboxylate-amine ligase
MMTARPAFGAFEAYGIEMEFMIVDRDSLAVRPVAAAVLRDGEAAATGYVARGGMAWSNEIVRHLVEVKNDPPQRSLAALADAFAAETRELDRLLAPLGARLMPGAMHPWMNPAVETCLWQGEHEDIYRAYDRIFDCRQHGQANLQSMHLNLPFCGDGEFARLHAAVRLLLPILPALAAASPIAGGRASGFLDYRMEAYRLANARVPSVIGRIVPDTVRSRAEYETQVLAPMYQDMSGVDPQGVLRHEWLNCRGAVPRFERSAIEIRVIDMQECVRANLAVAAASCAVSRLIYESEEMPLRDQRKIGTAQLAAILESCVRDGDHALIEDAAYLQMMHCPAPACEAGELWYRLLEQAECRDGAEAEAVRTFAGPLRLILENGPLARRIVRAVGGDYSSERLHAVYRELCDCLAEDRMFVGMP